jgi:hypothetical protein
MMATHKSAWAFAALMILACPRLSAADPVLVNGSFDESGPSSGCVSATTSLYGWTVESGNLDIDSAASNCSGVTPADGQYFIDLLGSSYPATISQQVATEVGVQYVLTFWYGGNSQWQYFGYSNDGAVKSLRATAGSASEDFSIDTTGAGKYDAQWTLGSIIFTADSTLTTISFQSLNTSGVFGPFLDGVTLSVYAVPEPGTLALFGLGLVSLGFVRRSKLS